MEMQVPRNAGAVIHQVALAEKFRSLHLIKAQVSTVTSELVSRSVPSLWWVFIKQPTLGGLNNRNYDLLARGSQEPKNKVPADLVCPEASLHGLQMLSSLFSHGLPSVYTLLVSLVFSRGYQSKIKDPPQWYCLITSWGAMTSKHSHMPRSWGQHVSIQIWGAQFRP